MKQCAVLYEGWQMQCCGDPFAVGDEVDWPVNNGADIKLKLDKPRLLDYCYEAHDRHDFKLRGKVLKIDALYYHYKPSAGNPKLMVPAYGFLKRVEKADGWDKKIDGAVFAAYLVSLEIADDKKKRGKTL